MEVPCCGGPENAVRRALQASGKSIPWQVVIITTDGRILEQAGRQSRRTLPHRRRHELTGDAVPSATQFRRWRGAIATGSLRRHRPPLSSPKKQNHGRVFLFARAKSGSAVVFFVHIFK